MVTNEGDFAGKIQRVVNEVCEVVGAPIPVENQRRYKVKSMPTQLPA